MTWLSKIFKTKTIVQLVTPKKYTNDYFEGKDAFKIGRSLFSELVLSKSISEERRKQKLMAALEFFDKAIEKGYDDAEAFSFRAMCLRDLNYDIDAIDDHNKCIDKEPRKASFYYDRAITKQYMYDYKGSLIDFKKAIELSKLDNDDTRYWNDYAKKSGFKSCSEKYEYDLQFLLHDMKIMSERLRQDLYEKRRLERRKK